MSQDMSQYLSAFLDDATEQLQALNDNLLQLEKDPADKEIINTIFRSAHSLKGASAAMGFTMVRDLTHKMENVLDDIRNDKLIASRDLIDILFECFDALNKMLDEITTSGNSTLDVSSIIERLIDVKEGSEGSASEQAVQEMEEKKGLEIELRDYEKLIIHEGLKQGIKAYSVLIKISPESQMKEVKAFLVYNNLENLGEIIRSFPDAEMIETGNFDNELIYILMTKASEDEIESKANVSEIESVTLKQLTEGDLEGEEEAEVEAAKPAEAEAENDKEEKTTLKQPDTSRAVVRQETIRVDTAKLDQLMNLVGELVINGTMFNLLEQNIKKYLAEPSLKKLDKDLLNNILDFQSSFTDGIAQLARVSAQLQESVMQVRMVPVGKVFNRFPRMVRDMTRNNHKEIELQIFGEETEVDKTVSEEIGDPLVHLIRNSVDHGVEFPEERQAAGKPPTGIVKLSARHEGNNIIIEVDDDGNGIDPEKIRKKALEKEIITEEAAAGMTEQEIIRLIFAPGFSTAAEVTDISGRGVGMDVVRRNIEKINGSVDVTTQLGKGSRFIIKLPLTLAIISALMVQVRNRIYAVPMNNIVEIVKVNIAEVHLVQGCEVVKIRDEVVPLLRVNRLLALDGDVDDVAEEASLFAVIITIDEKKYGLIVDELIGQQEVVIKSLSGITAGARGLAGASVLGDGSVALILDIQQLVNLELIAK